MKFLVLIAAVLLIRLPFLNQAVTGDDDYYLASAQHALIDPLHPNHTFYVLQGKDVDFRGYPHPPLNAWCLAFLLAIFHDMREIPFHAAYLFFSLLAVTGMWRLAKRFSPHPFWATLAFVAVPAFTINGNSFESDIPLVAFWTAGISLFIRAIDTRRLSTLVCASLLLGLASLTAVQALAAIPILAIYLYRHGRSWKPAWLCLFSPGVALGGWQFFEYFSIGRFPILITTAYVESYGLARLQLKLSHALGLAVHFCFLMFPLLLPAAALPLLGKRDRDASFLLWWIGIFFATALGLFYSGSARYLLPLAPPLALLVSRFPVRYLRIAVPLQLAFSLLLAAANYQHWSGYREFARSLAPQLRTRRAWVNAEWGLRWYLEAEGALPIHEHQRVFPGDIVVSSELAYPVAFNHGGCTLVPLARREITSSIPFRLIALDSHSGYSTSQKGFLPFGISTSPIDRVRADLAVLHEPALSFLTMSAPEADLQLLSGVYSREGANSWRWTAQSAVIALKPPPSDAPLRIDFTVLPASPVRSLKILAQGREIFSRAWQSPGSYSFDTAPIRESAVELQFDRSFSVPGDGRTLAVILSAIGYNEQP